MAKASTLKIAVIGAGAWGTTLSILFKEKGHQVTLWIYEKELIEQLKEFRENKMFLPGFQLPASIRFTGNKEKTEGSDIFVFASPTPFLRIVASQFKKFVNPASLVVSVSKGIEEKTLKLPQEILKEELDPKKLAVLCGPNLSREIAKGLPAASVAASRDLEVAKSVQEAFMLERFRVYTNTDPCGVQLGGALKNVIAIAAGVADGLGLGNNALASLMIRGIAEITRLGVAMGANPLTFAGLSGAGDLIATCSSKLSRNHRVGEELAKGKKLSDVLARMKNVAEGVQTVKAAMDLGKKHGIELPVASEVYRLLYEGKNPFQCISDLMTRSATSE